MAGTARPTQFVNSYGNGYKDTAPADAGTPNASNGNSSNHTYDNNSYGNNNSH